MRLISNLENIATFTTGFKHFYVYFIGQTVSENPRFTFVIILVSVSIYYYGSM